MNLVEAAHLNEPVNADWRISHKEAIERLREAEEIVAALPDDAIVYGVGWDRISLDITSFRAIFGGRQCLSGGDGYLYVFIHRIKVECFDGSDKYRQPERIWPKTITLPANELVGTGSEA